MSTARKPRPDPRQLPREEDKVSPVIARIREDARIEPRRWLREAEVPAGGE